MISAEHFCYSRDYPKTWLSWTTHRKLKQVPKSSGFVLKKEFSSLKENSDPIDCEQNRDEVKTAVTSLLNKFSEKNQRLWIISILKY